MSVLQFTAWGRPIGQGNHVRGQWGGTYEKTKGHAGWRKEVIRAATEAIAHHEAGWEPLDGPIVVSVMFFGPRPNGHYGTGRNAGQLKRSAPTYPTTLGAAETRFADIDKLARALLDGLTFAGVIVDDARVTDLHCQKRYAEQPAGARAVVTVYPQGASVDAR